MAFLKFVLFSVIGLLAFLAPITFGDSSTILIGHIKNFSLKYFADSVKILAITTSFITVIGTTIALFKRKFEKKYLNDLFVTDIFTSILRISGALMFILVVSNKAPEFLKSDSTGGLMATDLIPSLMITFFAGILLMPLLTSYGLVEFVGVLISPFMKKVFKVPGYAAIDALASFVGDGTIGIVVTDQQYQKGYYSKKEAVIIATSFSIVGISFAAVVADILKFSKIFWLFYLTIVISTIFAGFIIARLPLKKFKNEYYNDNKVEEVMEMNFKKALDLAKETAENSCEKKIVLNSLYNVLLVYITFIPLIMCIGSLGLIIAEKTQFFNIISTPLVPILKLLGFSKDIATEMAPAMIVGLSDMYLPALFIEKTSSEVARFIIGTLSFSQLIFFSETGVMLLNTKLGFNILDVIKFFILRTIITFPVIYIIAQLLLKFGILTN